MPINGVTVQTASAFQAMAAEQLKNQAGVSALAGKKPKAGVPGAKAAAYDDIPGRIRNIPSLSHYKDAFQRLLSGESALEEYGKPLTDDQLMLRHFMRALGRTDTRSLSQMTADMSSARNKALDASFAAFKAGGGGGGVIVRADGTYTVFNSKAEHDAYIQEYYPGLMRTAMSVMGEAEGSANGGIDVEA